MLGRLVRLAAPLTLATLISVPAIAAAPAPVVEAAGTTTTIPILMFHLIQDTPAGTPNIDLYVKPADFDREMAALKARGWHSITAAALGAATKAHRAVPVKTFVMTFDDGTISNYVSAFPILRKYGFVGTFYTITVRNGRSGYMTWDQLAEMTRAGMEIANHTVDHHDFSRTTSAATIVAEITGASTRIVTELARRGVVTTVTTFAYPYGHTSPPATAYLARMGYTLAVTTVHGKASTLSARPMLTPRVRVSRGETLAKFLASLGA